MSNFDTFAMVDWSGGNDTGPTPKADAIWIAVAREHGVDAPVYLRNRTDAEAWLADLIEAEMSAGRRLCLGFDFPFGYPSGFARAVTGSDDPLALWHWFAERIEDAPKTNNRFDIAGELNRNLGGGKGPFWGNGLKQDIPGLPRTKADYVNPFPDRRDVEERAKGAFTCWQMSGAGAVGSQVMMGLPVLQRLRRRFPEQIAIWPFEPLARPVAFVEIWPSLTVGPAPTDWIKDVWQVHEVARSMAEMTPDALAMNLDIVAPEEGWIFGVAGPRKSPSMGNDCFALPPGVHWTPVDEALADLQSRLSPVVAQETLPVGQALDRVLSTDVTALRAHPPQANTAVDGYGLAGGRGAGSHQMPLHSQQVAAGHVLDTPVPEGKAVRILTGAALPPGVDTVILQEDCTVTNGVLSFEGSVKQGANTRAAGEDVKAGDVVLPEKRRLTPADLALMSAVGVAEVAVCKPLRVAVISTGDELVDPGQQAGTGQIYDANRPMLKGLITQLGHVPVDMGRVADDRDALRAQLDDAASRADVILTSGGASAGDADHVSALLNETGAMALWRIAIKPGRPLALGVWKGRPVFGLPGNPVAAMVCTLVFAAPALAKMAGGEWTEPQGYFVPAAFEKRTKGGRREFLRARVRDGKVEIFASEGSGRISGLSWAEGFVELPDGAMHIRPDDPVRFIPWAGFGLR